jgi:transglutaminase-like putative cysteine protease
MHVAGRTPLHLRMEVYDLFDGVTWYPIATDSEAVRVERPLRPSGIQHWLQLDVAGRGLEIHGPPESRGIRLLNLGGNVLPLPPHTTELSIERVDRADMYRVLPGQRVGLARDDIPEMTTVNIVSEAVDRDLLRSSDSLALVPWSSGSAGVLPSGFEDVKELAASITASVPHGWQQVEAISEYVRTRHELDRSARIPEDSPSPVHHFLFETQRGPEYMFAASTAALLRSAGYAARLVSGFYVHPDKYDPRLQHTPVHARDSHFWCEVSVGSNAWIMVDASPGYVEEDAPQGFWERLTNTVVAILVWLKSRWLWLSGAALVAIFTYRHRVSLEDRWLSIRWKWLRPSCPRRAVQTLSRITEWRLRQAGFDRSGRPTLHRVAGSVNVSETSSALSALASLFDWAAYSPVDESSGIEATALDAQLNALQDTLNLKHLTELAKETRAGAPRQSDDTRATRASGRRQRQHAAAASTTTSS